MVLFLYNLSISNYGLLLSFVSFFNKKAKLWVDGRKNILQQIENKLSGNNSNLIWIHCASLGEFEQGRPVIEGLKQQYANYKIVLTFFSPSGYEIRKNYTGADYIFYLPIDKEYNAVKFIQLVNPKLAIFVKYELWFHYLNQLKIANIPSLLISANFRSNQLFFKPYGGFYKNILFKISHIFVQNNTSFNLLKTINYQNFSLGGDTRFDRVANLVETKLNLPLLEQFKAKNKVVVIGSCWQEDFDFLLPFINNSDQFVKFVIAPHELHQAEMQNQIKQIKGKTIFYSKTSESIDNKLITSSKVLMIDNIGLLSSIYQYADICWIGGGFGKGLHNILEAATFGIPIFFGNKNYNKFQEAVDLVDKKGAFAIENYCIFEETASELLKDKDKYELTSTICKNYVHQNVGATKRIINFINTNQILNNQ